MTKVKQLHAAARLELIEALLAVEAKQVGDGGNISVEAFLKRMGQMGAGLMPVKGNDCRATVIRSLAHELERNHEIVIVGEPGHPIHTFTVGVNGQPVADSYHGRYHDGIYTCTLSNGEHADLQTLYTINVHDFIAKYVDPLQVHGHVVPRPDGLRTKCGGPSSRLACAMCAREVELLAGGIHPLMVEAEKMSARIELEAQREQIEARKHIDDLPFHLDLKLGFASEEQYRAMAHFLAAVEWEGTAGHSVVVGMFVDGDGSDRMQVKGIPPEMMKVGQDMARLSCEHGDNLMLNIGPDSAQAYNDRYGSDGQVRTYTRDVVYPEPDDKE